MKPITTQTAAANGDFMSHTVQICWLKNCRDTHPVPEVLSIKTLAERFSKPQTDRGTLSKAQYHALRKTVPTEAEARRREKDGTAFIPATFKTPGTRVATSVQSVLGFVLDFDGEQSGVPGVTRAEFETELAGIGYLAFTTYSHQPSNQRWRVFIPYKSPCTPDQHRAVYKHFHARFQGRLDDRSATSQQLWYTPACPYDAVDEFEFFVQVGELFDPCAVQVQEPTVAASANTTTVPARTSLSNQDLNRVAQHLARINADDRDTWIKVAIALKREFGDAAKTAWDSWSKTSSKFDQKDSDQTWQSLQPRDANGVTLGTVFHLANQLAPENMLTPTSPLVTNGLEPLFDLTTASVSQFLKEPPAKRRWLLHNTLPLGKVALLVAPGGTGKSFFSIQLAVAVATGTRLANRWEVGEIGSTLILCAEEDDLDIHHRLRAVLNATVGDDPAMLSAVSQRVLIKSMLAQDNLMTRSKDRGEVVQTDYVDRLLLTVAPIPDLRLIVIDPASRFRGGDEIAAQDTTRFVETLERLRAATGATVLLIHHVNKGSANAEEPSQIASRGSSALTDGVRWQMNLARPNTSQAKQHGIAESARLEYVLAAITKNNGAPPQEPVMLRRGAEGVLTATDSAMASRSSLETEIVNLLKTEAQNGRTYTANSLERRFGGTRRALRTSAGKLRLTIAKCVQMGLLKKRKQPPIGVLEVCDR